MRVMLESQILVLVKACTCGMAGVYVIKSIENLSRFNIKFMLFCKRYLHWFYLFLLFKSNLMIGLLF